MVYAFGPFELDSDLFELRRQGDPVKLAPKAFDLLLHLVRHPERVVSKSELLEALWPGEHVTESVLPANVNAIRKALGDERGEPRFVQTVHGRGYRFVAVATELAHAAHGAHGETEPTGSDFVGRTAVMSVLGEALESSFAGRGGMVLLAGEPGIGKTRTAEELAREARSRDTRILEGRCDEDVGAPVYWPWIQVLRRLASELDDAALLATLGVTADDLAHLVPEIASRVPTPPDPLSLDSDEARFRLFDSVACFLRAASEKRPLLLVFDDLHWADEPTLLLLRFVAGRLGDARILLLAIYRDVELRRSHPLARTLGELAPLPHVRRVTLRGLEQSDVARYVETATQAAGEPVATAERLAHSVFELTEGNPFFMQEMVRLLAAEGRLAEPVDATSLPQGVREAIGRRLDALDEGCNDLLRLAAVIGSEFGVQELEALSGVERQVVLERLEQARAVRLLREEGLPPGRFTFSHVLVRETLYEELSTPERVRLHGRVGEILEALRGATAPAHAAELAHHFFQAAPGGGVERAIRYAVEAAAQAHRLLAFEEAVNLYERSLEVLPLATPVDEAKRCNLLTGLGEAQLRAGRREAGMRSLRTAADVARQLARGDLLARVAITWPPTMGRQLVVWNAEYRPLVEEALSVVDESALAVRARLVSALAITPPDSNSMERRAALSLDAVDLARRSGDDGALFVALEARLWALAAPERQEERLAVATERLALAQRAESKEMIFEAREQRIRSLLALFRNAEADADIEECEQLAQALRLPTFHLSVARFRLTRALSEGRLDDAERLTEVCNEWSLKIDDPDAGVMRVLWLLWISFARGELGRLTPFLEDAVGQSEPWMGPPIRIFAAFIYAAVGDLEAARGHFDSVKRTGFENLPHDEDWLMSIAISSHVCADISDKDSAEPLYRLLLPFADANVHHLHMRHYMGVGHHCLARLAALIGWPDVARDHFESALAGNVAGGARLAHTLTLYHYGTWLQAEAVDDPEHERSRDLLAAAGKVAGEMGAVQLAEGIRQTLESR